MPTESRKNKNKLYKLLTNVKVRTVLLCFCMSGALWLFVVLGKTYQYNYSLSVSFVNADNPHQNIYCSDSIIDVHITSSGFDLLASRLPFRKTNNIQFDIGSLSLNMQSGRAKIPTGFLNKQVLSEIRMQKVPIQIMPDTLILGWNKTYSKQVPLVSRVKVECKQPFGVSQQPELIEKYIWLEGNKESIEKIDTLFTKEIILKDIDRNFFTFVPIDFDYNQEEVSLRQSSVGLSIKVREYTENDIILPIDIIAGKNDKLRLFPSNVKIRYKVAMEDFKKVNTDELSAYVIYSKDEEKKKLRVMLSNVPDFIKIISISPSKVDYIIQK